VGIILGMGGRPAGSVQIIEFLRYATERNINLGEIWLAESDGKLAWAVLPMVSPGRTALLFTPAESVLLRAPADELTAHICRTLANRDIHLAQVLIDPAKTEARNFFAHHGFVEMAELLYLNGHAPRSPKFPVLPPGMRLENYSPQSHHLFAAAITASYQNSLDCPGLMGMRDIEDVIAGHRATGEFEPTLWHALYENDIPLGVLLLSRIQSTDSLELVYLGLAPPARGRGLGDLLMQLAMWQVIKENRRRLSCAVDSINIPASKLYYRFGMSRLTSKIAMVRDLRPLTKGRESADSPH
jgi:ribosomal protein S18 acetylase RimI-like enzyme